jgi:hypothetical protein
MTTSALVSQQWKFVTMFGLLISFVKQHPGWAITFGEAYRPSMLAQWYAKMGMGIANSKHCQRLAIDVNFFIDGVYQTKSEAYAPLGQFWESIGGRWGGRFKKSDGNHFEV